jgi:hypothetical protein
LPVWARAIPSHNARGRGSCAIKIERGIRGISGEQTPTDEHLAIGLLHGDNATTKALHLTRSLQTRKTEQ